MVNGETESPSHLFHIRQQYGHNERARELVNPNFHGHLPDEILHTELNFMAKIGMERFIGTRA